MRTHRVVSEKHEVESSKQFGNGQHGPIFPTPASTESYLFARRALLRFGYAGASKRVYVRKPEHRIAVDAPSRRLADTSAPRRARTRSVASAPDVAAQCAAVCPLLSPRTVDRQVDDRARVSPLKKPPAPSRHAPGTVLVR